MEADWAKLGWDIIQTGITAGVAVYVWWSNRHRANKAAIDAVDHKYSREVAELKEENAALDNRLVCAETAIQYMPNDAKFSKLHERMDKFNTTLSHLEGSNETMSKTLALIHTTLMNMDKKQ